LWSLQQGSTGTPTLSEPGTSVKHGAREPHSPLRVSEMRDEALVASGLVAHERVVANAVTRFIAARRRKGSSTH